MAGRPHRLRPPVSDIPLVRPAALSEMMPPPAQGQPARLANIIT